MVIEMSREKAIVVAGVLTGQRILFAHRMEQIRNQSKQERRRKLPSAALDDTLEAIASEDGILQKVLGRIHQAQAEAKQND